MHRELSGKRLKTVSSVHFCSYILYNSECGKNHKAIRRIYYITFETNKELEKKYRINGTMQTYLQMHQHYLLTNGMSKFAALANRGQLQHLPPFFTTTFFAISS